MLRNLNRSSAGKRICGTPKVGVIGSLIPSSGDSGPGYTYNDLSFPADANKEICGQITAWPSAGTLFAHEDTSFEFTDAPNGTYTFQYQLYVDGVATGSPTTVTLTVGGTTHVATGSLLSGAAAIAGAAAKAGVVIHSASGALSASAASISGTAAIRATHAAAGAMAAGSAQLSALSAIRVTHEASGSLLAGSASLSGTTSIRIIHDASGALVAGQALLIGSSERGNDYLNLLRKSIFVRHSSNTQTSIKTRETEVITVRKRTTHH